MLSLVLSGGCIDIITPDPAVRYVAFGDSMTKGPSEKDYHEFLRERLGMKPETFANEGHGGETTDDGLQRLVALLNNEIYPNAEVLLYWEGGNNVTDFIQHHDPLLLLSPDDDDYLFAGSLAADLDGIQDDIESAIRAAHDAGLEVRVATYFHLRESIDQCPALPLDILLPYQAERANVYIGMLNERIRQGALSEGATLVDVETINGTLHVDEDNYHNCNHLSAQGNELVADLFYEAE